MFLKKLEARGEQYKKTELKDPFWSINFQVVYPQGKSTGTPSDDKTSFNTPITKEVSSVFRSSILTFPTSDLCYVLVWVRI